MQATQYVYAVARVRAVETQLLSLAEVDALLAMPGYAEALQFLADHGYGNTEDTDPLRNAMAKTWDFIKRIAPELDSFSFLLIRNDFHNLKAAIKAFLKDYSAADFFIYPSLYEPEDLSSAVGKGQYDRLPAEMQEVAKQCYDILVATQDGQQADALLDAQALALMRKLAAQTHLDFVIHVAEVLCATANIKTAARAIHTKKGADFLRIALSSCNTLQKERLMQAALAGEEGLVPYLQSTPWQVLVEPMQASMLAFEKACDALVIQTILPAKHQPFGADALIAYYLAKEYEIKNLRILLTGKRNALSADMIRERLGSLYV